MLRRQPLLQSWSPLVGIKTSGSRSPFFCVHPVGGNVLCYNALAQHFDQEQPFYGLQLMNWHEDADLPALFEETATRYIEAIRKQPHGPILSRRLVDRPACWPSRWRGNCSRRGSPWPCWP